MRSLLSACLLVLLGALPARAHPGVGIVLDRRGNVFYTDLVHVWRIAPDGAKSVAVRNVHTHALAIDSLGNLYGEESQYLGGDRFRNRVWRRSPHGRISHVLPWRDGTYPEYGFVRDGAGAMYWVRCVERRCEIRKRTSDGRTSTFVSAERFDNTPINSIAAARNGSVYVVDGPALRRFRPDGRAATVANGLGSMMGLWVDNSRNSVYVAVYGARSIVRVDQNGRTVTVARTPAPWAPSGITVAPDGTLWLLEYSTSNAARVRRIAPDGRITIY